MRREAISGQKEFASLRINYRRKLVVGEISLVFLVSIFVTAVRFQYNLDTIFFEYPGQPKIFLYPIIFYYFLQRNHSWEISLFSNSKEYYSRVFLSSGQTLIAFSAIAFLIKYPISRIWVIANVIATVLALSIFRYLMRIYIYKKQVDFRDVMYLFISGSENLQDTLDRFQSMFGFTPKYIQFPPPNENGDFWLKEFKNTVDDLDISGVVIGYGQISDSILLKEISDYKRNKVQEILLMSAISPIVRRFEMLENPTVVRIRESHIVGSGAVLKRMFDIAFAFSAIVILSPLLLVISILVRVTSPGPVLYVAKRVGKDGKLFDFPKFRSMYKDSDKLRLDILGRPDDSMADRYKKDPRITPFGRFIRRWSIDELPQFWSVLVGDMSVVGPRPILPEELEQIDTKDYLRFIAKPGLTGLWQVTGRKEVAWKDRMERDIAYIEDWSFAKDIILILKTIQAIFKGQGAH